MYVYVSEKKHFTDFPDRKSLFWFEEELQYGDWVGGPSGDGSFSKSGQIEISDVRCTAFIEDLILSECIGNVHICVRFDPRQVVHTLTHLSVTKQYNLVLAGLTNAKGWKYSRAGKLIIGLMSHYPCITG